MTIVSLSFLGVVFRNLSGRYVAQSPGWPKSVLRLI